MSQQRANVLAVAVVAAMAAAQVLVVALTGFAPGENGGAPVAIEMVPGTAYGVVGAWLLYRRPEHRVGWLLAPLGVLNAVSGSGAVYADWAVMRGHDPHVPLLAHLLSQMSAEIVIVVGLVLLPLLFPTGRLPSPRWRWLPATALVLMTISQVALFVQPDEIVLAGREFPKPYGIEPLRGPLELIGGMTILGVMLLMFPALGSLVVRFRRARGQERQQLRWFVLAMVANPATFVLLVLVDELSRFGVTPGLTELVFDLVMLVPLTGISLSIGAAVLKYRLYDVDRILSRTVSYASLTFALAGVYVGIVLAAQSVLGSRGDVPDLVVAAATLLVAALFGPLRRRIQARVDRRFSRNRYDAAQLVAAFAARLRDQVQVDTVVAELGDAAGRSLAPASLSVWVARPDVAT